MKLYCSLSSPFVRKVRMLLEETGRGGEIEIELVKTSPMVPHEALRSANPLAKIPALARDDGPTLYDSRVICEFLDTHFQSGLYHAGWDSKVLEATGDGITEAALQITYERRFRSENHVLEDWIAAQMGKIHAACAALNARWMSHLKGPLDMGQISVACALGYVDFRHPDAGWRQGNEALADWYATFESLSSFAATRPE
ncbi:glutathione S-transferase [Epibacterium ulvae]|uniref:glutathione S-transferase n=1 Tax=Epibacterium ulvae TaxID=1156985 RepID=UPI00248FD556|nr:glutathione S-transferase [Epibacterium ulvae]